MDSDELLKAKIHAACLKAALALGPDIKKLSWFGRNAKRLPADVAPTCSRASTTESGLKVA